jgi:uroporphyrinogen-III synthase
LNKKIFISKGSEEIENLEAIFQSTAIDFISHSFLEFEYIPFQINKPFDIVFISSLRSAKYFFKNHTLLPFQKIACIGKSTADYIEANYGVVSFVGKSAGKPDEVAKQFEVWSKEQRILFPVSDKSLQTISKYFSEEQKEVVIVYKTLIIPAPIEACSIYIFTSPSNVEGFLKMNNLSFKHTIIAWGTSTEKALLEAGIQCQHTLKTATIEELASLLKNLITFD